MPDLGRPHDLLSATVRINQAMGQHRQVDVLTDGHAAHLRLRAALRPVVGRFSGVVADVLLDHELAAHWSSYHTEPADHFRREAYRDLQAESWRVTPQVRSTLHRLADDDWLGLYATPDGIASILAMMSDRLSARFNRQVDMTAGADWLRDHPRELRACFIPLWSELVRRLASADSRVRPVIGFPTHALAEEDAA